ncbi:MAG TPA: hypothetical protein VG184_08365 [Acidimicrobiales bacterium]|nr:hypothetical protein [Acidimicrobiales bacterium]
MAWWTDGARTAAGGGHLAERLLVGLSFPVCGVEPLIRPAIADHHLDVHSQWAGLN